MAIPTDFGDLGEDLGDFEDLLWQTDDDFEPYGMAAQISPAAYDSRLQTEHMLQIPLYVEGFDEWQGE